VTEVADAGEQHGQAEAICSRDDFGIALRAAGLDDRRRSGFGDFFDAVGKREKGVGGGDSAFQRSWAFMAPILAESTRDICPAPTPTVWPSRA
jgi:hypothetical protein